MNNHNSLLSTLSQYSQSIFFDIRWLYGPKTKEWGRDLAHFLGQLEVRGPRFVGIELPALAKHFDQCLDHGHYSRPEGLHHCRPRKRGTVLPVFLERLYLMIFDSEGKLREDPRVEAIVAIRQLLKGLSKLKQPCRHKDNQDAIQEFVQTDKLLPRPTLHWVGDAVPSWSSDLSLSDNAFGRDGRGRFRAKASASVLFRIRQLERVADLTASLFGDFHEEAADCLPKHGPGVVSNMGREEYKYNLPFWNDRLEQFFPQDRYRVAASDHVLFPGGEPVWTHHASKLILVPKTLKAPRLIAAEPVENQWIQQLVKTQLEQAVDRTYLRHCIDFSSQEKNQQYALEGSATGEYSTVDLSSASDRLSCLLIERLFRRNPTLLDRIWSCRTQEVKVLGHPLLLRKFATMGSAVIFPLQTIVYALIACSVCIDGAVNLRSLTNAAKRIQVFGDDIVIPKDRVHQLKEVLNYLFFKVNEAKTFTGQNFRESCGIDAFRGINVTPVYINHMPPKVGRPTQNLASIVSTSNNLHRSLYWTAAQFLDQSIGAQIKLVPTIGPRSTVFGRLSYTGASLTYERYNKALHRYETKVLAPVRASKVQKQDSHASLLQYFVEKPEPDFHWESGLRRHGRVSLRVGWQPSQFYEG